MNSPTMTLSGHASHTNGESEMEEDPIRRAASQWLRDNEQRAREILAETDEAIELQAKTGWSDAQINNILTYLGLVMP